MFRTDSQELEWKVIDKWGGKYEGQLKKGTTTAEGYGTIISNYGWRHRGYFKNDKAHGYGIDIWYDGEKYAG